jgi:Glycosyl hydrolases family 39
VVLRGVERTESEGVLDCTQKDYFRLYRVTAEAIKRVDALLKVGGPATARDGWIEEFLELPPHAVAALTVEFARP